MEQVMSDLDLTRSSQVGEDGVRVRGLRPNHYHHRSSSKRSTQFKDSEVPRRSVAQSSEAWGQPSRLKLVPGARLVREQRRYARDESILVGSFPTFRC